ncbi:hypothetical protein LF887_01800 [Chryseobacterium sp. MEBOG06]|uniref:hypothetical protein n=1 Tax=Chryseobacterium sp. MEBOG06 TaxID=2879938 RepID=UPI001F3B20DC|nr:hypothetical protein [Chryseobacterium sp. MEBOG06]UKB84409.1 hypothetical protein LF887_01800 [Chryseobacterium sp. MEBOG06]
MIKNKLVKFVLIILFSLCLFSCNFYSEKDAKKYLPGTYLYQFPSGETSILVVNQDFKFNNKVYSKDKKYLLYKTNGTMEVEGRHITFYYFLLFFDHNESEMVFSKPDVGLLTNSYWEKPKDDKDVSTIEINSYNYIFKKIE